MIVQSRRFGKLELPDDALVRFEQPILGFSNLKEFVLFKQDQDAPIFWLQSVKDPSVAFLLVDPTSVADYVLDRRDLDESGLELEDASKALVLAIVTLKQPWHSSTANLRAPVIIDTQNRKASQVVLRDDRYGTKENIFETIASKGGQS